MACASTWSCTGARGAADLLARLAKVYLGPDAESPAAGDTHPGVVTRIALARVTGVGPWTE